ncbi:MULTISPECIES: metal ABC transporter ATP-binding protein [unclassified Solwaraspora]|uniref:metal ABC transporter ATP-binding protein n=1 Tax=unclassified Solwaraspora TaxID=2627926 RepID=UPI00248C60CA|nr:MULTISPECIES: metal ABC transporter ATP-binding protein [unclassified Solwaraspora]WBB95373.1 metal ABC transporter ATP-binding protein [Solwaraspora sp. WMMA2059]WBC20721.1 metal ABC transporter ATP-binding protein [Solwaraspora sp. WMMA2080]WJK37146.1 metal ABC transporter ATP-binding protein [Solwaraspora sp. WMMA2065]
MTTSVVQVSRGAVGYDNRTVLRSVDLTVTSGEVVALLGANGSGKSTLIRAALGLVPLRSGSVHLFGVPATRFRQWHRIGYVPQRLGAGSGVPATVGEVVASGRLARRGVLRPPGAADRTAVAAALSAVGLADRSRDPVATLSGGQQQRTLIARALAGEPELLVLDEPTAGVDAASQEAFARALGAFVAGNGTVLLVAHELGPLQPLIDRAVVLHHGEVVHDGAVPAPAGHHADPGHDHVHPHAAVEPAQMWTT